jgi:ribosomal protein S18 acetylase RimI-like enzyme
MVQVLDLLTVDKDHQRMGVGAKLLDAGLADADHMDLPVYLEATAVARELYARSEFKEIGEVRFDLARYGGEGEWTTSIMVRESKSVRESERQG